MSRIVFVDTEVSIDSGKVCDYGAVNAENEELHTKSEKEFADFIRKGIFPFDDRFICGHNIIAHDLKYIENAVDRSGIKYIIDTLYLSSLLFPNKPYYAQQIWKAIKNMTRTRPVLCRSPLEIARQAGWDDTVGDIETRVKTAVLALENAGYISRGKNVPMCFASGITVPDMATASVMIERSDKFDDISKTNARRIISSLISSKSIAKAGNDDAESRVDYIADRLGIPMPDIIHIINLLREEGMLI